MPVIVVLSRAEVLFAMLADEDHLLCIDDFMDVLLMPAEVFRIPEHLGAPCTWDVITVGLVVSHSVLAVKDISQNHDAEN